jgi:hypothetical protein
VIKPQKKKRQVIAIKAKVCVVFCCPLATVAVEFSEVEPAMRIPKVIVIYNNYFKN